MQRGPVRGRRLPFAAAGWLAVAALVAALLWVVGALPGVGPALREPAEPLGRQPGLRTEGLHLVGRRGGVRQWELDAALLEQPASTGVLHFSGVEDGRFYRSGQPFLTFRGEGGRFDEKTGQLLLDGLFYLDRKEYRLEARNLTYDGERRELVTGEPVRLESPDMEAQAGAMRVDVETAVAHFTGGVRVRQGDVAWVEASAARWDMETGEMVLFGPSRAEHRIGKAGPSQGVGGWPR